MPPFFLPNGIMLIKMFLLNFVEKSSVEIYAT